MLRDLSFTLPPGAAIVVTGSNGAGKSTLLRAIAGFISLLGGTVALRFPGPSPETDASLELQEHTPYLGHGNGLKLSLTAAENLRFAAAGPVVAACPPTKRSPLVDLAHVADFRFASFRPASGGASLWPASRRHAGPCGSWTNLPRRSTPHRKRCWAGCIRAHLDGGGLVLAAVHGTARPAGRARFRLRRMIRRLAALFRREFAVARRIGGGGATGLVFFLALVTVIPFGVGPDLNLLARIGPAMLWIAALLATLLGLDRLFQADHEDGSLDQLRLGAVPLELVVLVKCARPLVRHGLPLVWRRRCSGSRWRSTALPSHVWPRACWSARPP